MLHTCFPHAYHKGAHYSKHVSMPTGSKSSLHSSRTFWLRQVQPVGGPRALPAGSTRAGGQCSEELPSAAFRPHQHCCGPPHDRSHGHCLHRCLHFTAASRLLLILASCGIFMLDLYLAWALTLVLPGSMQACAQATISQLVKGLL